MKRRLSILVVLGSLSVMALSGCAVVPAQPGTYIDYGTAYRYGPGYPGYGIGLRYGVGHGVPSQGHDGYGRRGGRH